MTIVVLCGGLSRERDVSITSGALAAGVLRERGHRVLLLDLFLGYTEPFKSPELAFASAKDVEKFIIREEIPDIEALKALRKGGNGIFGEHVLALCQAADMVFMALHGEEGENGMVQAVFDSFGIRYTGTGYLGSALAMDKGISKQLFIQNKIPTPASAMVEKSEDWKTPAMPFPCVVKPCSGGSSVGVSVVQCREAYEKALADAFAIEERVLIEQYIEGREFSVGVLGGKALPVIEICPKSGFYDYKNKYQPGMTDEYCPADIPNSILQRLQELALAVYHALHLEIYARMDFRMDGTGALYCLEANTLPGMTDLSLLPQEALAAGISYGELCETILRLSMEKYS